MKTVVCIKPVKTELVYPNKERNENFLINPYDLYALEKTIELKKRINCEVICLCMGAVSAEPILRKALAIGADEAILVTDRIFIGSDTVATTYILSEAIKKIGNVDLVVCGEKTIDGETGQVAIGLSERLKHISINKLEEFMEVQENKVTAMRKNMNHMQKVRFKLPATVIFHKSKLSQPTISLMAMKRTKNKMITYWNAEDIGIDSSRCGLEGSKTKVVNVKNDLIKKRSVVIGGTNKEKASFIYNTIIGKNM